MQQRLRFVIVTNRLLAGFPLDLENLENERAPGKPGNIMEL